MSLKSRFPVHTGLNIRYKLLLSYIAVVFLPVVLVGTILTLNMKQMALERAAREASYNAERIQGRLAESMKTLVNLASKVFVDQNLDEMLTTSFSSTREVFDAYRQYRDFNDYRVFSKELDTIKLYYFNETLLENGQFLRINDTIRKEAWFNTALKDNGRFRWQYLYNNSKKTQELCFTVLLLGSGTNRKLGVLNLTMNNTILDNMVTTEPYETLITDDNGNILTARNPAFRRLKLVNTPLSHLNDSARQEGTFRYNDLEYQVISSSYKPSLANGEYHVYVLIPLQEIQSPAINANRLGLAIMIAALVLAMILVILLSNTITRRVRILGKDMHRVATGDFDVQPSYLGQDELGQLSQDMAIMAKSLKSLVDEVYAVNVQKNELTLRQRDIKLKMLANQINPHFLFNALETIRMKAHSRGEKEIADAVKLLGRIMRRSLEAGSEPVSLDVEMDLVRSYLEIQRFRYGARLTYTIDWPEDISRQRLILPLLIQPIVENAVVHGVEGQSGVGEIVVRLEQVDETLFQISVIDNGKGMDAERLNHLRNSLYEKEDTPGKRIGLRNVHQRIKLQYGEQYGVEVDSQEGTGTQVRLLLPWEV